MCNKIILLTGQCSLHNARMEFGNLGNFYIIQPLIEQLKNKYHNCLIYSTLQFSDEFSNKYNIKLLPLEYYYSFENIDKNLENTLYELNCSYNYKYNKNNKNNEITDFMKYIIKSDIIIEFNGDIWGDNADLFGKDRFLIGLYKTIIFQNCNNNVYNFAGSPGPFIKHNNYISLIKNTYKNYKLVINREKISTDLLQEQNFNISNILSYPCPSWLFKSDLSKTEINSLFYKENIINDNNILVGLIICGWNIKNVNWDETNYNKKNFIDIINVIKYINQKYCNYKIILISHNNAFDNTIQKMKNGRDYFLLNQLYDILKNEKDINMNNIILKKNATTANETKGFISKLDYMISGRLHGSVAALTSYIPTIMLEYMNGPESHKLNGFSNFIDYDNFICNVNSDEIIDKFEYMVNNKTKIINHLKNKIQEVKTNSLKSFDLLE